MCMEGAGRLGYLRKEEFTSSGKDCCAGTRRGDRSVEADADAAPPKDTRPSIGIALSGGAARGFAHIGVLQTLLAHGLKPEIVAGTSMGAVIGGCYAAGQLEAMAEWARSLTRRRMLGYLDVSLAGSGLINGARLARQLEKTIGKIKIEALEVHFAAVATEIETGHEVWLTRGRLLEALRASYALPGRVRAGADRRPLAARRRAGQSGAGVGGRALDARLVIGVNTNADLFGRGTIDPEPRLRGRRRAAACRGGRGRVGARDGARRSCYGASCSDGRGGPACRR